MKHPANDAQIDALFGLEPVFEPAALAGAGAEGSEFHNISCPYCGESFETLIDLSAGSQAYIEDCQVCCQPIEFRISVDHAGTLTALETLRHDA